MNKYPNCKMISRCVAILAAIVVGHSAEFSFAADGTEQKAILITGASSQTYSRPSSLLEKKTSEFRHRSQWNFIVH